MVQSVSKTYQAHTSTNGSLIIRLHLIYKDNTTVKTKTCKNIHDVFWRGGANLRWRHCPLCRVWSLAVWTYQRVSKGRDCRATSAARAAPRWTRTRCCLDAAGDDNDIPTTWVVARCRRRPGAADLPAGGGWSRPPPQPTCTRRRHWSTGSTSLWRHRDVDAIVCRHDNNAIISPSVTPSLTHSGYHQLVLCPPPIPSHNWPLLAGLQPALWKSANRNLLPICRIEFTVNSANK